MISNGDSLAFAMQEMQDSFQEWQTKEDGVLMYVDFNFASRDWLEELQREIVLQPRLRRIISYGDSFGTFPRCVRIHFCPIHAEIPLLDWQAPSEELSDIYRAKREQREQCEGVDARCRRRRLEEEEDQRCRIAQIATARASRLEKRRKVYQENE
jgi:hypothetical protein